MHRRGWSWGQSKPRWGRSNGPGHDDEAVELVVACAAIGLEGFEEEAGVSGDVGEEAAEMERMRGGGAWPL